MKRLRNLPSCDHSGQAAAAAAVDAAWDGDGDGDGDDPSNWPSAVLPGSSLRNTNVPTPLSSPAVKASCA